MGKQGGALGGAGGIDGPAVVLPRGANFSTVEGLPAGEGVGVGEDGGQGAVVGSANAVVQQLFDVIGVLAESTE